jgi:hypothetical protein
VSDFRGLLSDPVPSAFPGTWGEAPEALVVHQPTERVDADKTFADVLVAFNGGMDTGN